MPIPVPLRELLRRAFGGDADAAHRLVREHGVELRREICARRRIQRAGTYTDEHIMLLAGFLHERRLELEEAAAPHELVNLLLRVAAQGSGKNSATPATRLRQLRFDGRLQPAPTAPDSPTTSTTTPQGPNV